MPFLFVLDLELTPSPTMMLGGKRDGICREKGFDRLFFETW
jgi:hypothetical protein